jgi:hypothetical protein
MALYMVGYISYGATLVFYAAAFPRLARNTASVFPSSPHPLTLTDAAPSHSRALRERYEAGEMPFEAYERAESLEKNRVSNISTVHSNVGYIATLGLSLALLLPPASKRNPRVDNYVLVLVNSYWVVTGIWWCACRQQLQPSHA